VRGGHALSVPARAGDDWRFFCIKTNMIPAAILQDGQPALVMVGQGSSYRILRSLAQYWLTMNWGL